MGAQANESLITPVVAVQIELTKASFHNKHFVSLRQGQHM